jgi:hypothetical protein
MAVVRAMTDARSSPDTELMRLRRRTRGDESRASAQAPMHAPEDPAYDDLLIEGDALVDSPASGFPTPDAGELLRLYRPLSSVSLLAVPWGVAVDHERLQDAIACGPLASVGDPSLPAWLRGRDVERCDDSAVAGGALFAGMTSDDVRAMDAWSRRASSGAFAALRRAALLPSSIVGADEDTAAAALAALASYRRSALVHAMLSARGEPSPDVARERDASAISLVSTLKALLGET